MRNPIENLPLQEMTRAIFNRLTGKITKLDGSTVIPVYDAFPETIADRYDHIELAGWDDEPEPPSSGLSVYSHVCVLVLFSSYNGQKEIEGAVQQVNSLLAHPLSLNGFSDIGSSYRRATLENFVVEGETRVIRKVEYRRRWIVSDHKH